MSSDNSDDNITLKEYQSRLQKAFSSQFTSPGFDVSISEYDDSDRDDTWKPTKEDLLSSSDDMDSDLERHKRTPKKNQRPNRKIDMAQKLPQATGQKRRKKRNCQEIDRSNVKTRFKRQKYSPMKPVAKNKDRVVDVEMIIASIIEDDIMKHVYKSTENDFSCETVVDTEKILPIASIVEDILENVYYNSTENDSYDTAVDIEMIIASIIEDDIMKCVYNSTENDFSFETVVYNEKNILIASIVEESWKVFTIAQKRILLTLQSMLKCT